MTALVPVAATGNGDVWLTAVLRPAGVLAGGAIDRFVDNLMAIADRANLVIVNLVAATVPKPAALARALRRPGRALSGPDRCLLLVGADEALLRELRLVGGEIATVRPELTHRRELPGQPPAR
ncbi:MAG TPA: hypothetical protein VFE14_01000 [Micromonosporaceae bacterium]|jgi:hypothetical protein|nr:hypothetical protein [Micromonosporaceae bacterium]